MKKQLNLSRHHAGKLRLNKKTISNLSSSEMSRVAGGASTGCTDTCHCPGNSKNCTRNQNTCPGHASCYPC